MRGRTIAIIIIIGLVSFGGYNLYRWANRTTTTYHQSSTSASSGETPAAPPQQLGSVFFTTQIPAEMTIKSRKEPGGGTSLFQMVARHQNIRFIDQLAITIGPLPTGGLSELSAVRLRQQADRGYVPTSFPSAPPRSLVFTKQGTYEKSVFMSNGNYYASIVVGGAIDRSEALDSLLSGVLSNWRWL